MRPRCLLSATLQYKLRRRFLLAGCVLLLAFGALRHDQAARAQTPAAAQAQTPAATQARVTGARPVPKCLEPTPQTIYAPTVGLAEAAGARIVFNSRADVATEVRPTFYTAAGEAVAGSVVTLQPAEIRTVDLNSLLPAKHRRRAGWGGISLSYVGKVFDIWAQIMLLGPDHGGSTDVTFSVLNGLGSPVLEAVWWMPARGRAVLALGNSSDARVKTTLHFADGDARTLDIAPHATEYVRVQARGGGRQRELVEGYGESVRLDTDGPAGSLKAAGLVAAADGRLVSSVRFADTRGVVQPHLFATNMKLRGYAPRIVLKNTSATSVTAQPRFRPVNGEDGLPVELAPVTLAPGEIVELNLDPLMAAAAGRDDLAAVSVAILNSGAPGSLIGALNGAAADGDATYDAPLRDSGPNRNNSGAYPWRIDGDFASVVSITNVGSAPSHFIAALFYDGGKYLFGPRAVAVGETALFDLKKIRDERVPDANGDLLPAKVASGQFRWHWYPGPDTPHLIGRSSVVSAAQGVSASYSCVGNCESRGPEYWFGGDQTVLVDGFAVRQTKERWYYSGNGYYEYACNMYDATVDDPNMASLGYYSNGWLQVNGLEEGDTYFWWTYFFQHDEDNGFDCQHFNDEVTGIEPVTVLPTITVGTVSVSRSSISPNQNATLSIRLTASSGLTVDASKGVTLEVGIANASSSFQLGFSPNVQTVTLSPGESKTFTVLVSVAQAPAQSATCNLTAVVSAPTSIAVVNNNAASGQLIVNP
ncbi:MAG TPA: hypothetical protein VF546_21310 [Pyrinomonadaceae bacterium]|jgi:hypothetical protein